MGKRGDSEIKKVFPHNKNGLRVNLGSGTGLKAKDKVFVKQLKNGSVLLIPEFNFPEGKNPKPIILYNKKYLRADLGEGTRLIPGDEVVIKQRKDGCILIIPRAMVTPLRRTT